MYQFSEGGVNRRAVDFSNETKVATVRDTYIDTRFRFV